MARARVPGRGAVAVPLLDSGGAALGRPGLGRIFDMRRDLFVPIPGLEVQRLREGISSHSIATENL